MFRDKLEIDLRHFAVGGFVFDPQIRQQDFAVDHCESVLGCHFCLPLGVLERRQASCVREQFVDSALKLIIEDDALNRPASLLTFSRFDLVHVVDRSIVRNFLECIKSRQNPTLNVDVALRAQVTISMAVQSYREGRVLYWDDKAMKVTAERVKM